MNCSIRKWRITDANDLAKALNNTKVQNNLRDGLPYPYTVNDAKDFITSVLSAKQGQNYIFAITVNDLAIGSIGVFRQSNIHFRTAEIGYYLSEEYWCQGIGSSAVRQICDYIFKNTDIIRIFAQPFAANIASCRILEKAGFVYEGLLRQNAVKNGQVIDMKIYALIK